jgi:hypothetical protein
MNNGQKKNKDKRKNVLFRLFVSYFQNVYHAVVAQCSALRALPVGL